MKKRSQQQLNMSNPCFEGKAIYSALPIVKSYNRTVHKLLMLLRITWKADSG